MVTKKLFGMYNNAEVYEYTIKNGDLSVNIIEFGATIHNIMFNGVDCVAGYDDLDGYVNGGSYQGATVGRCDFSCKYDQQRRTPRLGNRRHS